MRILKITSMEKGYSYMFHTTDIFSSNSRAQKPLMTFTTYGYLLLKMKALIVYEPRSSCLCYRCDITLSSSLEISFKNAKSSVADYIVVMFENFKKKY